MLNILVIAAHPDDAELGMGATIANLVRLGHQVNLLDLTDGEPTPCGSSEIRKTEAKASADLLKVRSRTILDLPNRFLQDTIEARIKIAAHIRRIKPEVVFAPFWIDKHPDHAAASQLSDAAVFYSKFTKSEIPGHPWKVGKIYYFPTVHFRLHLKPSFIVDVSQDFPKKLEAIKSYRSQFVENKENLFVFDYLTRQAGYYGSLINRKYGEAFLSREEIGIEDVAQLI
ncbi:MAG: bacillithiol biosynthesis deacetylase BshB1 [bacterium]